MYKSDGRAADGGARRPRLASHQQNQLTPPRQTLDHSEVIWSHRAQEAAAVIGGQPGEFGYPVLGGKPTRTAGAPCAPRSGSGAAAPPAPPNDLSLEIRVGNMSSTRMPRSRL
jgi:hypothetical protein